MKQWMELPTHKGLTMQRGHEGKEGTEKGCEGAGIKALDQQRAGSDQWLNLRALRRCVSSSSSTLARGMDI
jgi:hypothetical protein